MPAICVVLWALAGINLASLCLMGLDKWRAWKDSWRIRERTLWLFAFLMGAYGATLGMYLFRHKTRHPAFRYGLPALCFVQLAILIFLIVRYYPHV